MLRVFLAYGMDITFKILLGGCLVAISVSHLFLPTGLEAQHSDKHHSHKRGLPDDKCE